MQAGKALSQSLIWRGLYYLAAFVINILIARHFQASVSGVVYYLSSIYALVLLFSSLSLESGIIYFTARKEMPAPGLFNFAVLWSLGTGLITWVVAIILFREDFRQLPSGLVIFSSVSFILGNLLITYCSGFFYANNKYVLPNAINIVCTLLLIVLLPYNGRSVVSPVNDANYFYMYFGSFLLQGICVAIVAKLKYIKTWSATFISRSDFNLLFRYCSLAFLGNIIYFFLYRVDYWFVERYCSAAELGNYIQVSKLGHLFFILPTILASAVFPLTAGGKRENIAAILTLLSRTIFFSYLFLCLLLALTGKWLFPFVFGESFSDMYLPFLFLIPGILSLSGLYTLTAYFAGSNQLLVNITGSVYSLLVIVTGDIIFIPLYGIQAAALISSAGYMVYQAYIIWKFKKEFEIPLDRFFLIRMSDLAQIKEALLHSSIKKDS